MMLRELCPTCLEVVCECAQIAREAEEEWVIEMDDDGFVKIPEVFVDPFPREYYGPYDKICEELHGVDRRFYAELETTNADSELCCHEQDCVESHEHAVRTDSAWFCDQHRHLGPIMANWLTLKLKERRKP